MYVNELGNLVFRYQHPLTKSLIGLYKHINNNYTQYYFEILFMHMDICIHRNVLFAYKIRGIARV